MIRLGYPLIEDDDLRAVQSVLESGYLVQGKHVSTFEKEITKLTGSTHAIAVSSCTAALHLSLLALDVQPGDIVLVPAYSWIATANVVELCHARPFFIDIQRDTFNIDPNALHVSLERLMSNSNTADKVKAILPVHCFGQLADMPKIVDIAQKHGVHVVEDAACAFGSTLNKKQAGTWGTAGCFSFHPRKAFTTGEGGVIITDDTDLAQQLRTLRNHGMTNLHGHVDFVIPGFNYRLTDFQGALGVTQLKKIDRLIDSRLKQASCYNKLFQGTAITTPYIAQGADPVYQSYVILLPEGVSGNRDKLITYLKKHEIEATIGTINMPMTSYFMRRYSFVAGMFPVTDNIASRSISLPLHENLTTDDQEYISRCLINGLERFYN
ncbi:DegT/DnrJ/EryC1/StrS family aminotransferase [Desulforhopalus sp. 52FAK]